MKTEYKVVSFERIPHFKLQPHPAAELPIDYEDQESLQESMADIGLLTPLLVTVKQEGGCHQILDGINRWRLLKETPDVELPCMLVECENPREIALTCLSIGRKRSTGQRVMAYLEMHREEVLRVAKITHDLELRSKRMAGGHVTGREIPAKLQHFTADAIAQKLRVSNKDVGLGIEVLLCIEEKQTASYTRGSLSIPARPLDMEVVADCNYLLSLKKVHTRLLSGHTPVRRWKAAVGGMATTEGKRVEVNYGELADRAMISLRNAFRHWKEVDVRDRQILAEKWTELLDIAESANLMN